MWIKWWFSGFPLWSVSFCSFLCILINTRALLDGFLCYLLLLPHNSELIYRSQNLARHLRMFRYSMLQWLPSSLHRARLSPTTCVSLQHVVRSSLHTCFSLQHVVWIALIFAHLFFTTACCTDCPHLCTLVFHYSMLYRLPSSLHTCFSLQHVVWIALIFAQSKT